MNRLWILLTVVMAALALTQAFAQTVAPLNGEPKTTERKIVEPETTQIPVPEIASEKGPSMGAGLTYATGDRLDKFWIDVTPRIKRAGWAGFSGKLSTNAVAGIISFLSDDDSTCDSWFDDGRDCQCDNGPTHSGIALLGNFASPIGKAALVGGVGLMLDVYSATQPYWLDTRYKERYTSLSVKPVAQLGLRFNAGGAWGFELGYSTNGSAYMTVGLW